jgi:hypothetical protein
MQKAINNYLSKIIPVKRIKNITQMKNKLLLFFTFSLCTISCILSQTSATEKGLQAITSEAIKAQLGFLSSDLTEGRLAGEKGEYLSGAYIASILQIYGVKPAGDLINTAGGQTDPEKNERSYFQNFVLLKTVIGDEQILKIKSSDGIAVRTTDLTWNVDFLLRPSDQTVEIESPVIFAGYGYKNDSLLYNDLSKLDVRGKFILKISGVPLFIKTRLSKEESASIRNEMEARYKAMGALGILEFDPESLVTGRPDRKDFMNLSPSENNPYQEKLYARYTIPGKKNSDNLIKVSISVKTANEILKGTGIILEDYIRKADRNEKVLIPNISGRSIYLKTSVKTTQLAVRNILGMIEGKNPDKYILLGAHYDHLGISNGYIWNGADDNASGTVGVMTIAKAIMATGEKPEYTIVFALWTAEEEGLLGSHYYIRSLPAPAESIVMNMNFDMISRYISEEEPLKATMTYTASHPKFREITAANIKKYGINLLIDYQPSENPPGGTDHRSFVEAGIPVIRFKPGHREEYHTPSDESGTIDWDIMEKIIKISFADTWELANSKW